MNNQTITKMPVLFVGHGNPMNSISDNQYTRAWAELGNSLPKPKAILAISAHWYVPETSVTVMHPPRTIHDFYGFPQELFQVEYPVPGSPQLAEQVADLLSPDRVGRDREWGIDHGTWSVLRHIYPQARIPVIQLSLNFNKNPEEHFRLGEKLHLLRNAGVLIVASGNIVHNLAGFNWHNPGVAPSDWARDFEEWNRRVLLSEDTEKLIDYHATGKLADFSVPTPDHYLPLLYLAALRETTDEVSFPVEGFDGGTMSMLSVLLTSNKPPQE
jgi:4,5-DOPA dioxygenase extradiol